MKDVCSLYPHLLSANQDAFNSRLFKVAYYSLAGALQCALELKDAAKMAEVGQIAEEQLQALKTHFPQREVGNEASEIVLYRSLVRLIDVRSFLLRNASPPSQLRHQ